MPVEWMPGLSKESAKEAIKKYVKIMDQRESSDLPAALAE